MRSYEEGAASQGSWPYFACKNMDKRYTLQLDSHMKCEDVCISVCESGAVDDINAAHAAEERPPTSGAGYRRMRSWHCGESSAVHPAAMKGNPDSLSL